MQREYTVYKPMTNDWMQWHLHTNKAVFFCSAFQGFGSFLVIKKKGPKPRHILSQQISINETRYIQDRVWLAKPSSYEHVKSWDYSDQQRRVAVRCLLVCKRRLLMISICWADWAITSTTSRITINHVFVHPIVLSRHPSISPNNRPFFFFTHSC